MKSNHHHSRSRAAKPGQTFTTWIMQFRDVDDLLGDLANDIARDPKFPATGNLASYSAYLEQAGARLACLEAFEEAWDCFESRREPGQFFGVDTVTCANWRAGPGQFIEPDHAVHCLFEPAGDKTGDGDAGAPLAARRAGPARDLT